MAYYVRLGLILFLIAAIASGILAFVNGFTKPIIEENQRQLEIQARQVVLPQAATFEFVEANLPYYRGYDEDGNLVGYTFMAIGSGYSGDIQTMVGADTALLVTNISIISQTETPGLGANCTRPDFTDQYSNKCIDRIRIDKDGGYITTITGATITTRALSNSIVDALKQLGKQLKTAESKDMPGQEEAA